MKYKLIIPITILTSLLHLSCKDAPKTESQKETSIQISKIYSPNVSGVELSDLIKKNDNEGVKKYFKENPNWINAHAMQNKVTPLMEYLEELQPNMMDTFLELGANLQLRDSLHRSIMCYVGQNLTAAEWLLKNGIKAETYDKVNNTPLMEAATGEIATLLIKHGANPLAQNKAEVTPMIKAIENNRIEVIGVLLQNGVKIEQEHLFLACEYFGKPETLNFLIKNGGNPHSQTENKETLLHRAAHFSNASIIKSLLSKKVNPDIKNLDGKTPLDILGDSQKSRSLECINLLKEKQ